MNMGAQTLESELAQVSADAGIESNKSFLLEKENGKSNQDMGIKFGSHLTDEPSKKEVENLPESKFPKDAADDWPEPKQVHQIYMVKYRPYEDQKVKAKLDLSEKELRRLRDIEYQIREKIRAEKVDRYEAVGKLKAVGEERRHFWSIMDEKKKEMEPLQQALGKLRGSNAGGRERSFICHSEEELNNVIKSLQYRIQHESIPLSEEKQIIREIKQLEGTRDQVKANVVARAEIEDALGEKQAIQDQVKLIGVGLDEVRKEHKDVTAKRDLLQAEKDKIDDAIDALEVELQGVIEKIKTVISRMKDLQKQLSAGNESFYQNRTSLNKARELAVKKDVEGLKELVGNEVDHFISQWNSSKAFRDDYESRILQSLDMRQLSRDGRMRNPDEKPLVVQEPPTAIKTEVKPNPKQVKDESSTSTVRKASKEKSIKQENEATYKVGPEDTVGQIDVDDSEAIFVLEKLEKDPPLKKNAVNEVKLKELKREEEMAKAKQALERKKKLAEKAAAKAAIKAQKEAEKKLKDREKKAKKKAAVSASVTLEEPSESADDVVEPENIDEIVEAAAPASSKNKERKEKTARHRGKAKGVDSFPKVVLKRKKSTNYWVWAAPAALIVMLLIVIGYYYLI